MDLTAPTVSPRRKAFKEGDIRPQEKVHEALSKFSDGAIVVRVVNKICRDKENKRSRVMVITNFGLFLNHFNGKVNRFVVFSAARALETFGNYFLLRTKGQFDIVVELSRHPLNTSDDNQRVISLLELLCRRHSTVDFTRATAPSYVALVKKALMSATGDSTEITSDSAEAAAVNELKEKMRKDHIYIAMATLRHSTEQRREHQRRVEVVAETKQTTRDVVRAIYAKYNPERIDEVDDICQKFVGHETSLLNALRWKYGPEPGYAPPDADDSSPRSVEVVTEKASSVSVAQLAATSTSPPVAKEDVAAVITQPSPAQHLSDEVAVGGDDDTVYTDDTAPAPSVLPTGDHPQNVHPTADYDVFSMSAEAPGAAATPPPPSQLVRPLRFYDSRWGPAPVRSGDFPEPATPPPRAAAAEEFSSASSRPSMAPRGGSFDDLLAAARRKVRVTLPQPRQVVVQESQHQPLRSALKPPPPPAQRDPWRSLDAPAASSPFVPRGATKRAAAAAAVAPVSSSFSATNFSSIATPPAFLLKKEELDAASPASPSLGGLADLYRAYGGSGLGSETSSRPSFGAGGSATAPHPPPALPPPQTSHLPLFGVAQLEPPLFHQFQPHLGALLRLHTRDPAAGLLMPIGDLDVPDGVVAMLSNAAAADLQSAFEAELEAIGLDVGAPLDIAFPLGGANGTSSSAEDSACASASSLRLEGSSDFGSSTATATVSCAFLNAVLAAYSSHFAYAVDVIPANPMHVPFDGLSAVRITQEAAEYFAFACEEAEMGAAAQTRTDDVFVTLRQAAAQGSAATYRVSAAEWNSIAHEWNVAIVGCET